MNDSIHNHPRKLMFGSVGALGVAAGLLARDPLLFFVGLVPLCLAVGQFVRYWGDNSRLAEADA